MSYRAKDLRQKCFYCGAKLRPGWVCDDCRAMLVDQDHEMTHEEAARICERIMLIHRVKCTLIVASKEGGGFDGCIAWQSRIGSESWIAVAFYKLNRDIPADIPVRERRRMAFYWLLRAMLHEIAHHYKGQAGHGKRWRRCFEYLKRQWGVS